jgi:site-specific DNA-adenine methylase
VCSTDLKEEIMFNYYGSKSKIVDYYPPPKFDKLIEPFAGSARYSLKWWNKQVTICDLNEDVIDVWKWLQSCSKTI